MSTVKFLQFGCWNNMNPSKDNNPDQVIKLVKQLTSADKTIEFIIVSGDNYYPKKKTISATEKKKIIYKDNLIKGLNLLPNDTAIFMMLGNHDLETNMAFASDESQEPETENVCKIIQLELDTLELEKPNVTYSFFESKLINKTLILMLDTSIYEKDIDVELKYLSCYKVFFTNKGINETNAASIQALRDYQFGLINEALTANQDKDIKHVILVGHHPIYLFKFKEESKKNKEPTDVAGADVADADVADDDYDDDDDDDDYDSTSPGVKEGRTTKLDTPSDETAEPELKPKPTLRTDIAKNFVPVLESINELLKGNSVTYNYLCSDLHLYQKGIVKINSEMTIQQYIVGSGGTKLDKELKPGDVDPVTQMYNDDSYTFQEGQHKHGVLECSIDNESDKEPVFEFKSTDLIPSLGGKSIKKYNKKSKKKYNKKSKKKYTKKYSKKYNKKSKKKYTKKYNKKSKKKF